MTSTTSSTSAGQDDADVGVERAESFAREHPRLVRFARIGWVAKGVVYGLTGVLALLIGLRSTSGSSEGAEGEASQTGAIARIAENSSGVVLLIVMAAGLVTYAIWRLITVMLPADNDLKGWVTRIGYFISAVAYLALAWTAISIAQDPGQPAEGEDGKVERFTTEFMSHDGGRIVVFVVGAALVVLAGVFLWKAFSASFTSDLLPGSVGPVSHRTIVTLGRIGWVGRSGMMALIGFFLARAAINFDPEDAQGLDGSLRKAAESGPGTVLVIVVGVGLLVYGVFCVVSAPKQRLVGADS